MASPDKTPLLDDGDFRLFNGDALDVLKSLPSGSVHCVVTSPPYWGLRDYGTASWEGGNPDCDHKASTGEPRKFTNGRGEGQGDDYAGSNLRSWTERDGTTFRDVCGKCGARRVDQALGLEATPELYVERMVGVFREVRRVLRRDGVCWVNLGDSYASGDRNGHGTRIGAKQGTNRASALGLDDQRPPQPAGLKPKDLVGIPWRVAFALQADGWYLRSDVIWSKPNPMPESVTDRPTKAHEYVFLLTKSARYFFDQEAVREGVTGNTHSRGRKMSPPKSMVHENSAERVKNNRSFMEATWGQVTSRNIRSVWEIATQPYPEAHFATYPEELVRRCILAGCPEGGTVLDPFGGSGTTALVARKHGRRSILIELSGPYCDLAARRLSQLSLLSGVAGG